MTQDEIIDMAEQAGFWKDLFGYPEFKNHLETFAKLVAAKEREACAKVAEPNFGIIGSTIALGIRARGEA